MIKGTPVELPCPMPFWGGCRCERCAVCGHQKHMAIHGGVLGKHGMIFGHAFVRKRSDSASSESTKEGK